MVLKLKNRIEKELIRYIRTADELYSLNKASPLLFNNVKEFISRKGKRVRPILFLIGYLGFAKKIAPGLFRSALSLELLHDFLLIHDDIIDKSNTRRGKPTMHKMLDIYLSGQRNIKFNGEDLAIVVGDIICAMGMHALLEIKEKTVRKEAALKKLFDAIIFTGSGEFIELLSGLKNIEKITKYDIYKIYDYKTANYTFASPLTIGAVLAGANRSQINMLFKYGIYLGRAFQIKDDILGIFSKEADIGKSTLTDLQEAKKTILLWFAYRNLPQKGKLIIKNTLSKKKVFKSDLAKVRKLLVESKALECSKNEISSFMKKAQDLLPSLKMQKKYKNLLHNFCQETLKL